MMIRRLFTGILIAAALAAAVEAVRHSRTSAADRAPLYRQTGRAGAPVVITEFSDFQCPGCAKARLTLAELVKKHEGTVVQVFRHNPLKMHKWAYAAARAAESAGVQGKFWPYHDILFERQAEWSAAPNPLVLFLQYAEYLSLDMKKFRSDLETGRWDAAIQRDMADAREMNVRSTPTFFFNQRRLVGDSQLSAYGEQYIALEAPR